MRVTASTTTTTTTTSNIGRAVAAVPLLAWRERVALPLSGVVRHEVELAQDLGDVGAGEVGGVQVDVVARRGALRRQSPPGPATGGEWRAHEQRAQVGHGHFHTVAAGPARAYVRVYVYVRVCARVCVCVSVCVCVYL